MLRVIIVDDEPNIVEGLCHLIQGLDPEGLDVCKAYSGNEALCMIGEAPVDLILSDIRMPGMSGLQLLDALEEYWPSCRIIYLTGYGEFETIHAAFKSAQCAGYLLKTEGDGAILETVGRELARIERDKQNNTLLERARQQMGVMASLVRAQYLRGVVTGWPEGAAGAAQEELELHIDLGSPTLPVLGWLKLDAPLAHMERTMLTLAVDEAISDELGGHVSRDFAMLDRGIIVWLMQPSRGWTAGGPVYNTEESLAKYIGVGLQRVQNNIRSEGASVCFALSSCPVPPDKLPVKVRALLALAERMREGAGEVILTETTGQFAPEREEETVHRVKRYIDRNIGDKNLSLSRIAAVTYYNPSYLSRFFKQETGGNLSDYINEVRLSRAIELMRERDVRINEVAARIGFESPSYFTMFFKKRMGMTPNEYRSTLIG